MPKTHLSTCISSYDTLSFKEQPVIACTSQYIVHWRAVRHFVLFEYTCRSYSQTNEIFYPWELQNEYIIENPLNKENRSQIGY